MLKHSKSSKTNHTNLKKITTAILPWWVQSWRKILTLEILKKSKLHVVHEKNVIEAFDTFGPAGLFHLFLPKDVFYNSIRDWTNQKLVQP